MMTSYARVGSAVFFNSPPLRKDFASFFSIFLCVARKRETFLFCNCFESCCVEVFTLSSPLLGYITALHLDLLQYSVLTAMIVC